MNFMDTMFTVDFLKKGGHEANPLMAYLINRMGMDFFLGFKIMWVTVCLACVLDLQPRRMVRDGLVGLVLAFLGYTLVIGFHFWFKP